MGMKPRKLGKVARERLRLDRAWAAIIKADQDAHPEQWREFVGARTWRRIRPDLCQTAERVSR